MTINTLSYFELYSIFVKHMILDILCQWDRNYSLFCITILLISSIIISNNTIVVIAVVIITIITIIIISGYECSYW